MKRIAIVVACALVAGGAATALAQGGGNPYDQPEPAVTSSQVLHLPGLRGCTFATLVTLRVTPPAGAVLASLTVRVGGREVVRLTGIPRAASATLRLPDRGARITVAGVTLGGQQVHITHVYRRCRPTPASPAAPPPSSLPETGGGGTTT